MERREPVAVLGKGLCQALGRLEEPSTEAEWLKEVERDGAALWLCTISPDFRINCCVLRLVIALCRFSAPLEPSSSLEPSPLSKGRVILARVALR